MGQILKSTNTKISVLPWASFSQYQESKQILYSAFYSISEKAPTGV